MAEQNFKNHAQVVPGFLSATFVILVWFGWNVYRLTQGVTADSVITLLVSASLLVLAFSMRTQVLTVQDRLIRLESRLRMRELLPADLAARAADLPVKQLVAIRFAGDDELPSLVSDVLAGKLTEPKAIKQAVKQWQADHLRA